MVLPLFTYLPWPENVPPSPSVARRERQPDRRPGQLPQPGGRGQLQAAHLTRQRQQDHQTHAKVAAGSKVGHLVLVQSAALGRSQGFVASFLGSSTGRWAGTPATLLPSKKEIARGTSKKINTEPR